MLARIASHILSVGLSFLGNRLGSSLNFKLATSWRSRFFSELCTPYGIYSRNHPRIVFKTRNEQALLLIWRVVYIIWYIFKRWYEHLSVSTPEASSQHSQIQIFFQNSKQTDISIRSNELCIPCGIKQKMIRTLKHINFRTNLISEKCCFDCRLTTRPNDQLRSFD